MLDTYIISLLYIYRDTIDIVEKRMEEIKLGVQPWKPQQDWKYSFLNFIGEAISTDSNHLKYCCIQQCNTH